LYVNYFSSNNSIFFKINYLKLMVLLVILIHQNLDKNTYYLIIIFFFKKKKDNLKKKNIHIYIYIYYLPTLHFHTPIQFEENFQIIQICLTNGSLKKILFLGLI